MRAKVPFFVMCCLCIICLTLGGCTQEVPVAEKPAEAATEPPTTLKTEVREFVAVEPGEPTKEETDIPLMPISMWEAPISTITTPDYPNAIVADVIFQDLTADTKQHLQELITDPTNGMDPYQLQIGHEYQIILQMHSSGEDSVKNIKLSAETEDFVAAGDGMLIWYYASDATTGQTLMCIRLNLASSENACIFYVDQSTRYSQKDLPAQDDTMCTMDDSEVASFFNPQQGILLGDIHGLNFYETPDQSATVIFGFRVESPQYNPFS